LKCARDRAEDGDEHDEDCTGRERVAEQLEPDILAQRLCHDARTDDGGDQQGGSQRFRCEATRQIEFRHQLSLSSYGPP
jgi:hypothetical protein